MWGDQRKKTQKPKKVQPNVFIGLFVHFQMKIINIEFLVETSASDSPTQITFSIINEKACCNAMNEIDNLFFKKDLFLMHFEVIYFLNIDPFFVTMGCRNLQEQFRKRKGFLLLLVIQDCNLKHVFQKSWQFYLVLVI